MVFPEYNKAEPSGSEVFKQACINRFISICNGIAEPAKCILIAEYITMTLEFRKSHAIVFRRAFAIISNSSIY